jgi:hypothetical protein
MPALLLVLLHRQSLVPLWSRPVRRSRSLARRSTSVLAHSLRWVGPHSLLVAAVITSSLHLD